MRTCKYCGCTDRDCRQCIERTGTACYWEGKDVCSACSPYGFMMFGKWVQAITTDDRQSRIPTMSREMLQRALEWPSTQKSLLPKIRRLLKAKPA